MAENYLYYILILYNMTNTQINMYVITLNSEWSGDDECVGLTIMCVVYVYRHVF